MTDRSRLRLVVLQVLVLSLMATLLGRLWYLQVMAGDQYRAAADSNRIREVVTPAVRGLILDDKGRPLAQNITTLVVSVDRTELHKQPDRGVAVLNRVAATLGMNVADIQDKLKDCGTKGAKKPPICWNGSPYQPVPISENTPTDVALQIMERREDYPGVSADLRAVRKYPAPEGANAAHTLGYVGPVSDAQVAASAGTDNPLRRQDEIGQAGLEKQYDSYLRGVPGVKQLAVDKDGLVTGTVGETPSTPGNYLVTSIDAKVQAATEKALVDAVNRARGQYDRNTSKHYIADSASAVVMDVKTGRIVAMASYPTYDPNVWVGGISAPEYHALTDPAAGIPLISRATQGEFAPGSVFKVVSTTAAAQAGYSLNANYDCPSSYMVGNRAFKNFEGEAPGSVSLKRGIEVSCDTIWYKIAYDQWIKDGGNRPVAQPKDYFINAAKAWGLGAKTGIDLPAENSGEVVTRQSRQEAYDKNKATYCSRAQNGYPEVAATDPAKATYLQALARENCADGNKYRAGDAVNFSIGQGDTLLTPLQLARIYSAVANGGTIWVPQIGKAVVKADGTVVKEFQPQKAADAPISPQTRAFLVDAFSGTTVEGTGRYPFLGFPLGQLPVATKTGTAEVAGKQTTSWFASFAPANDPQYAIVMMVTQGGTGALTSGGSVRSIYEALFGINGQTIDPNASILPGGPPGTLPQVRQDGTVVQPASMTLPSGGPAGQPAEPVLISAVGAPTGSYSPPGRTSARGSPNRGGPT